MRKLDATASEQLNSVKVKISDDYFLIALAKSDQDLARNLDLMKTRAWFDFPLLLNDDRIAKLVFQKSPEGEAMLAKAFEAWKDEAPASPAPASTSTAVPPQIQGGRFVVPVLINGEITLKFLVDSGATDVNIPADVVMTLKRTGTLSDKLRNPLISRTA